MARKSRFHCPVTFRHFPSLSKAAIHERYMSATWAMAGSEFKETDGKLFLSCFWRPPKSAMLQEPSVGSVGSVTFDHAPGHVDIQKLQGILGADPVPFQQVNHLGKVARMYVTHHQLATPMRDQVVGEFVERRG